MNAYDFIRQSKLFAEWDGLEQPGAGLLQLAYDFLYHNCTALKPDHEHKEALTETLFLLKNGVIY